MNILIDTIEKFSGGYITYLKLLSNIIFKRYKIYILCSQEFFQKNFNNNKKIIHINKKVSSFSIFILFIFKKKLYRISSNTTKLMFCLCHQVLFIFKKIGIPIVTSCLNVHPFIKKKWLSTKQVNLG